MAEFLGVLLEVELKKKQRKDSNLNRTETYGNIELRYNNGEIDEVVMMDENGKCILHLEEMYDGCFSLMCYGKSKKIHVELKSEAKIKGTVSFIID